MTQERTGLDGRFVGLAAACLLLPACATVYEGKYAWSDGWRAAEVVQVTTPAQMQRPHFHECVRKAAPGTAGTSKFAVVEYRQMSRTKRRAVPLQAGQSFVPGDPVYVQADDCETPLVPRKEEPWRGRRAS
jgi:hypothetical protein